MGSRGRKAVDHFFRCKDGAEIIIPKKTICTSCNSPVIQPWKQFSDRLTKLKIDPQEFIDTFICRACKKASREGTSIEVIQEDGTSVVQEVHVGTPIEYKGYAPYDSKYLRIGYLFFGKYPAVLATSGPMWASFWRNSTASFDLLNRLCWKYYDSETGTEYIPQGDERKEMVKLLNTGKVYDSENMFLLLNQLKKKELDEVGSIPKMSER